MTHDYVLKCKECGYIFGLLHYDDSGFDEYTDEDDVFLWCVCQDCLEEE